MSVPEIKIIIMAYGQYTPDEAKEHKPAVVFVDEENISETA